MSYWDEINQVRRAGDDLLRREIGYPQAMTGVKFSPGSQSWDTFYSAASVPRRTIQGQNPGDEYQYELAPPDGVSPPPAGQPAPASAPVPFRHPEIPMPEAQYPYQGPRQIAQQADPRSQVVDQFLGAYGGGNGGTGGSGMRSATGVGGRTVQDIQRSAAYKNRVAQPDILKFMNPVLLSAGGASRRRLGERPVRPRLVGRPEPVNGVPLPTVPAPSWGNNVQSWLKANGLEGADFDTIMSFIGGTNQGA